MNEMMPVSPSERKILELIRSFSPYETIQITKDVQNRPDSYLVVRTSKVLLITGKEPEYVKAGYTLNK